jgi:hypothetical protein
MILKSRNKAKFITTLSALLDEIQEKEFYKVGRDLNLSNNGTADPIYWLYKNEEVRFLDSESDKQ